MLLGMTEIAPFLPLDFPLPRYAPFTTAMAREAGLTRHRMHSLVQGGLLRNPIRGVYLATEAGDSIPLRAACLKLVVPDDAVITDGHAGWLNGAAMTLAPNEHLALRPISMFRPSGHGRLRNKLSNSGERDLRPGDVIEVEGLPVTSPLRTAWDLGRVASLERGIAGLDAMLRTGAFTADELVAGVERFRKQRWVTHLRVLAPLADGRAESPGESVLRLRWIECALPTPDLQVEVLDHRFGFVARLDLGHPDLLYGGEYDGPEWHDSDDQREADRVRRDAAAAMGWSIDVFRKADVFGPRRTCETTLTAGVEAARRRRGTTIHW